MDSSDRRRLGSGDEHTLFNYGVTVAAIAVALLARWLFDPFLGDRLPYVTFFVAVAVASWLGGLRTGLLATGLGFLVVLFSFVPPRMSILGTSATHPFGLAFYLAVCLLFVGFGEVMRVAARREADQTERLRTTLASIGDAVITTDAEGRVTSLNAVAEAVTGWVTADACGKPLDAVYTTVDEATRQPVENQASRALKDGVPVALTSHSVLIRKDGSARPVDDSAALVRSKDGGIVGCVLVFRDVTDRHRAQEAMRRSEERFRLAADAVNGIVYEFEIPTGHVERQRGLYEVLGYRVDEVPPTAAWWWEQTHPDDREANEKHFRELVGNSVVSEYRVRHKDGRWLHVVDRAMLIRGDDGQPVRMVGCTVDVTAQKEADAELRRRETFTSGVLGSITDGFLVVNNGWRLTFANDEIVHRFGRRRDEVVDGHLWEMFPEAVGNEAYVTLHRAMADRVTVEYEVFYEPWQRWFLGKAFPTDDGGLANLTRDITDRKQAEGERKLLASIVENSPDFIGISDTHGNPLYGNRAAMELVGVESIEQVRRSKISDYFVPEQRQFVAEVVLPTVVKDGRWCGELTMQHVVTGATIPVLYDLFRVDDPATGGPINFATVTRDLTEPKRMEAEREATQRTLAALIDRCPFGIYIVDDEFRIASMNDGSQKGAFANVRPVIGRPFDEALRILWPEPVATEISDTFRRTLVTGEPYYSRDFVNPRADIGQTEGYEWELHQVTLPSGRDGVVCYYYDSTDLRRAERELRASEERSSAILESISDGFLTLDRDWRFSYVNRAGEQLLDRTPGDLLGKSLWEEFPGIVGSEFETVYRRVTAARVAESFTAYYPNLARWYEVSAYPATDGLSVYVRDVSDRQQTEERLRQSEARFRRVFESNVVGMIRWDLDRSLILDANDTFLRMTGYSRDDLAAGRLNFRNMTPAEWTPRNEDGIRAILTTGYAAPYEKEYFRKDGSRVPLIIAGTRFEDVPSEGMSFLIDISETKRAEANLRSSEERLRLIVESATDYAIVTMTTEGLIDGWNGGAARLFGYSELEVVGHHDRFLYTPEDAARKVPEREMKKAGAEGRAVNERWHVRKDGQRFWGSGLVQPLRSGGNVVGYLKIMRDMTEQQEYEERLRQSEEQRWLALDAAGLGMWHVDPATRACKVDARFRAIFGTTEEWTDYEQAFAVIHPDDLPAVQQAVAAATRRGAPASFAIECRIIRPDGSHRWVFAQGRLSIEGTGPAGRKASFDGTMADVTERKQIEQEREQLLGRLKEVDRKKDEFLATLAHELRNPLAPIRNGVQIMKLAAGRPDAVERSRGMIERQVEQMAHLIDDLMDLSRINQGKIALQMTRMRLAEAIRDAVDTCSELVERQGHHLALVVPDEPIFVDGDGTRLTQVFANLLNNAAKYTDRGGRLRLSVEPLDGEVVVSVEDNGVGITADMLPRVFDMFAQVAGSLNKSQGGLGIGLNIVKKLVEMHGGAVGVVSAGHGRGSTFTVRLPVAPSPTAVDTEEEPIEKVAPVRRRILVVDDNTDGAMSLAEMLHIMGNDTQTADDGLEAVSVGESFRPDVILMDLGMPRMNGFDACRCIRAEAWGKGVVMVAQTGWGQDDDKQKAKEAGFDLHMTKPIDPAALEKLLSEMSDGDSRLDTA